MSNCLAIYIHPYDMHTTGLHNSLIWVLFNYTLEFSEERVDCNMMPNSYTPSIPYMLCIYGEKDVVMAISSLH